MAVGKTRKFFYNPTIFLVIAGLLSFGLILVSVIVFSLLRTLFPSILAPYSQSGGISTSQFLNVSDLYKNINFYAGKSVQAKGKVELAPIVYQPSECPKDDPRCSCPEKRDLTLVDKGKFLFFKEVGLSF